MMETQTYLVTGAAGFIGWKVCEHLLAEDHSVVGVDNLNDAYDQRLKQWRLAQLQPRQNFVFQRLDICNATELESVFSARRFDAVFNLAGRGGVRQSVLTPREYYESNVLGTLSVLEMCRKFKIGKLVTASTATVYGANALAPFREDASTDKPLSPYAASKKAAETLCYSYHHLYGLDVSVLRYFTVYGPAGRPDTTPLRFVQRIREGYPVYLYGDGSVQRDYTFSDDVARATTLALTPVGFEAINIGSDHPIAVIEAIRIVEEVVGRAAQLVYRPPHHADMRTTWADVRKAEALLDWRPKFSFKEGIRRLSDWYGANRDWAKEIKTQDD